METIALSRLHKIFVFYDAVMLRSYAVLRMRRVAAQCWTAQQCFAERVDEAAKYLFAEEVRSISNRFCSELLLG